MAQMRVWTLAADDTNGTWASIHKTEHKAYEAYFDVVFPDPDGVGDEYESAAVAIDTKDYDAFLDIVQEYLFGSYDTYSVDEHTIDIDIDEDLDY
jgi:hypothetical protein